MKMVTIIANERFANIIRETSGLNPIMIIIINNLVYVKFSDGVITNENENAIDYLLQDWNEFLANEYPNKYPVITTLDLTEHIKTYTGSDKIRLEDYCLFDWEEQVFN